MLDTGETAPDFDLPGTTAGRIGSHTLTEYTDNGWSVVLVFYPVDFHQACTSQWCSLRDADWLTLLDETVVVGVGADSVYSHREYAERNEIGFTLLADTDGTVAEAYGVLADEFEGHRAVPQRATGVVAPDRTIRYAWTAAGPDDQPNLSAVRAAAEGTPTAESD
ncbi:redoxin domain-containing protein [Halosegnis sp.]|uniref:redoxin domain-containing protein n=1 Tax=Halosegnis sp. TaxID=2864959 RepID=UPI0035D487DF